MKLGFIILSRYNSTRLPGKALLQIDEKPILQHIVDNLGEVTDKNNIVVATSNQNTDQPIVEYCNKNKIQVYRGALENVADRFLNCALTYKFEYAVRVNGDNLFLDQFCLRDMIKIAQLDKYDFISNVKGRTYPKGMSFEIVKTNHYKIKYKMFNNAMHYEHVTQYLYQNDKDEKYFYQYNKACPESAGIQLAIDTPDDFSNAEIIIKEIKKRNLSYKLKNIFAVYKEFVNDK